MQAELLELMLCPVCGADSLALQQKQSEWVRYGQREIEEIQEGQGICQECHETFPIADYVLSFYDLMSESVQKDGEYWGAFYRWHYDQGYTGYVDPRGDVAGLLFFQVREVAPQTEQKRMAGIARLVEHPLVKQGGRLLDIGSGSGWTSLYLARRGFDVVAYDPGLENMRTAKEYAMKQGIFLECICAAMGCIRFKPESFDVAFAYHTLHHVPDLDRRMKDVYDILKTGGCIVIDEHIQINHQVDLIAGALVEWAREEVLPRYQDECQESFPIPPGGAFVNEDCSGWVVVPSVEKHFHVEMADYRYVFLDRFRDLYYLACGKSPESLVHAERAIDILYDVMQRAFPDGVECVALVGQKRAKLPPSNADRFERQDGKRIYRARTGPRLPLPSKTEQKSREPTPWWKLPGRALSILWHEGGAALVKEIQSYFTWLRYREGRYSWALTPSAPTRDEYARILRSLVSPVLWTVDSLQVGYNSIEIRGWAIAPQGNHEQVSFMINDHEFDWSEYPTLREDIGRICWYMPRAEDSGFVCRAAISKEAIFAKGYAILKCVDRETRQSFNNEHDLYYDVAVSELLPIPDADRRKRVQGSDSESVFLLEGFTTYKRLELALNRTLGIGYDDFSHVLDWGCGCGRSTRYFVNQKGASITGVDIDSDNIHWCQQNLRFGRFLEIPMHPPTNLRSSSFDLLIGISVFTHLREKEQFEWLHELRRIASSGAVLLMTFHGDTSVCRTNLSPVAFHSLKTKGVLDVGLNPDLDSVMNGSDYYRNTLHTREYVMEHWSKYFEIIDIIPGYIGNLQDLVIMRKCACSNERGSVKGL
jgi:2-polyprenyl-3-methyl-5-hydroxy-6-metoxy-1,4-benzoquinol methylase/uncharacterized protein YbaR (Trm112 family)